MSAKFLTRLEQGPLLCDGAMGTMLYAKAPGGKQCFDELNLTNPAVVAEVHRDYISAGAEMIETNTFGANRIKLAEYGLEKQVAAINTAGVALAHRVVEASFKDVLIAGAVGPLGARLAPLGRIQSEDAFEAFKEQVEALIAAGIDLLIFETFSDLLELEEAIAAARSVDPATPIVAQITFANDGLTPLGDSPAHVAEKMAEWQVEVVGVNCSVGPARVFRSIEKLKQHLPAETRLAAQPNAGWPQQMGGRLMYPATPDYFGDYAATFAQAGVSVIGGCCGTTPMHIAQMRQALDNPPPKAAIALAVSSAQDEPAYTTDTLTPTQLAQKLAAGEFVTSVELHPPRGSSASKVLAVGRMLQEAGATVVNVADSPVARMKMSPWAICHLLQSELGLETVLNFPTRGRNLLRIQGDLLAAHALNIRNLFVVMGDPTTIGDYPEAFNHLDVVPSGLIHLVKHKFNEGVDYAGQRISQPTNFLVGSALNLNAPKPEREIKLLKKKIDNGADFAMTQPIYELEMLDRFVTRYQAEYGPLSVPVLVSILPLYSLKHARFLHHEVPGIAIPREIHDRMEKAGDKAMQEGLAIAGDLLFAIKQRAQGVYIMPPFKRYDMAAELIEALAIK